MTDNVLHLTRRIVLQLELRAMFILPVNVVCIICLLLPDLSS